MIPISKADHLRRAASMVIDIIWELDDADADEERYELYKIRKSLNRLAYIAEMENRGEDAEDINVTSMPLIKDEEDEE